MTQRIDIYGSPARSTRVADLKRFIAALSGASRGHRLHVEPTFLAYLTECAPEEAAGLHPLTEAESRDGLTRLALSIGGDGTFLATANLIGNSGTPIMGINSGHLGYLSAADITHADALAASIVEGDWSVESRTIIAVSSDSPLLPERPYALNEVAILKQDTASMITVEARINGDLLANYSADGLIISTPTGSTGYNLSVGGPIIAPGSGDWVISPIAAHSLSMRPLVVSDDVTLTIKARSRSRSMRLAIDGRSTSLPVETRLTLTKAPFSIKVAHLPGYNFIDTLRNKLHWGRK